MALTALKKETEQEIRANALKQIGTLSTATLQLLAEKSKTPGIEEKLQKFKMFI